jgi:hypothetical protein
MPIHPVHRPNALQDQRAMDSAREVVRQSVECLRQHPKPDPFLGRKTQEPFPHDDDEVRFQSWLNSKGLSPPE